MSELIIGSENNSQNNLPSSWELVQLSSIIEEGKRTINPLHFPSEEFDYYSIPAFQENKKAKIEIGKNILSQKLIVDNDTILFGKLNPRVTKVWKVNSQSTRRKIASTEFIPLVSKQEKVIPDFLYFLAHSKFLLSKSRDIVSGSTPSRQRVDPSAFFQLSIPLPPKDEQLSIAHVLTTVCEAIEATERVIEATRQLKKSMMKHLFTYGPVPVDQADRVQLKQTEIGSVPESWKVVKLRTVIEKTSNRDPSKEPNKPFKYIDIACVSNEDNEISKPNEIIGSLAPSRARKVVNYRDTIFATVRPYLKNIAQIPQFLNDEICSTGFCVIRPNPQMIDPDFLFWYVISDAYVSRIVKHQSGSSYPAVSDDVVLEELIPLPPIDEQQKIAVYLKEISNKLKIERKKKQALDNLFSSLLANLMSGRVRMEMPEKDLITHLVELEEEIRYQELASASEEEISYIPGRIPILISAPHGAAQTRNGEHKDEDEFTAGLSKLMAELTGAHAIYTRRKSRGDPNYEIGTLYKQILIKIVQDNSIEFVLDMHGANKDRKFGIALGTMNGVSCPKEIQKILEVFKKNNFHTEGDKDLLFLDLESKFQGLGDAQTETVIRFLNNKKIPCAQFEINASLRIPRRRDDASKHDEEFSGDPDLINKTINTFVELVQELSKGE